jgi:hypothetical protein
MTEINGKRINALAHPMMDVNHRVINKMLTYATEFKLYLDVGDYVIGYGDKHYIHIDFNWHELSINVIECVNGEDTHSSFKYVSELEKFYDDNVDRFKVAAGEIEGFESLTKYFPLDEMIKISFWNNVFCSIKRDNDGRSYFEYSFDDDCDEDGRYVLVMKFPHEKDIYRVHTFKDEYDSERGQIIYEHMDDRDEVFISMADVVDNEIIVDFIKENL